MHRGVLACRVLLLSHRLAAFAMDPYLRLTCTKRRQREGSTTQYDSRDEDEIQETTTTTPNDTKRDGSQLSFMKRDAKTNTLRSSQPRLKTNGKRVAKSVKLSRDASDFRLQISDLRLRT